MCGVVLIWGKVVWWWYDVGVFLVMVGKYEEFDFWLLDFFIGGGVKWDYLNGSDFSRRG